MEAQELARAYLCCPEALLWHWSEEGRVLSWRDGTTIAFREEVEAVLARLSPRGLPGFNAVVLLLAMCRDGWLDAALGSIGRIEGALRAGGISDEAWRHKGRESFAARFGRLWAGDMGKELQGIAGAMPALPPQRDAKEVLAEAVFETWEGRESVEASARIIEALAQGVVLEPGHAPTISQATFSRILEDSRGIRRRMEGLTRESLLARIRTGLDGLIRAAEVELPPSEGVKRLITSLLTDREMSGLARLAHDLMAAVHVPRAISEPEELPLGGYSDLSNRGPLDRLLASELAHDDTTLAARVALNEALYLRREAPPRTAAGRRLLLIDAGIRMWGVPRVFAAAVSLALAATADRRQAIDVFRAEGGRMAKVDLSIREGLIAHLEALDPSPHPGAAVPAFLAAIRGGGARSRSGASDAILVTHEDVLADADFRAALASLGEEPLYVATVARSGAYRLYAASGRGRRLVSEARLSLDRLLERPKREMPGTPLLSEAANPTLPLILSVDPFPLLLPHAVDVRRSRYSERRGVLSVTKDGRLMYWREAGQGALQLTALVPHGPIHWMSIEPDGLAWLVAGARPGHRVTMLTAELEGGRCSSTELQASGYPPVAVARHLNTLFLVHRRRVDVFDLRSGAPATAIELPTSVHWQHGRYLVDGQRRWYALATDGLVARLQAISIARKRKTGPIVALFDREGYDGPWAVTLDGDIVSTADESEPYYADALEGPVELLAVSHDGHRLVLRGPSQGSIADVLFDLQKRTTRQITGDPHPWIEPDIVRVTANSQNLRHRFTGIGVDVQGRLALVHETGIAWVVCLDPKGSLTLAANKASQSCRGAVAQFKPTYSPPGTRYSLRVAQWKDGSRAYLDSRGMLHLKSIDRRLPEMTLVLTSGPLAGWCSDGRLFGPTFFTGYRPTVVARVFAEEIERFASRLR